MKITTDGKITGLDIRETEKEERKGEEVKIKMPVFWENITQDQLVRLSHEPKRFRNFCKQFFEEDGTVSPLGIPEFTLRPCMSHFDYDVRVGVTDEHFRLVDCKTKKMKVKPVYPGEFSLEFDVLCDNVATEFTAKLTRLIAYRTEHTIDVAVADMFNEEEAND